MNPLNSYTTEVINIEADATKAQVLIKHLAEGFHIADVKSPTDTEKATYAYSCGDINVFVEIIKDYIDQINAAIAPLAKEV